MSGGLTIVVPTLGVSAALPGVLRHNADRLGGAGQVVVVLSGPQAREPAGLPDGVRVVREPEPGLAAARERGVREAGAGICLFLDDDAAWVGGGVADVVRVFARDPRLGACGFNIRNRLPPGMRESLAWMLDLLAEVDTHGAFRCVRLDGAFHLAGAALAVRCSAWDASGCGACAIRANYGVHPLRGDDIEVQHRLLRAGWRVVAHPALVAEHRPDPGRLQRDRLVALAYWSCAGGAVARSVVHGRWHRTVLRRLVVALWSGVRVRAGIALRGGGAPRLARWAMHLGEVHGYLAPRSMLRAGSLPGGLLRLANP